jgi:hypothetical protein
MGRKKSSREKNTREELAAVQPANAMEAIRKESELEENPADIPPEGFSASLDDGHATNDTRDDPPPTATDSANASEDRADAFAAARRKLEDEAPKKAERGDDGVTVSPSGARLGRPPGPPKTPEQIEAAKLARRLREKNARRIARGQPPLTLSDLGGDAVEADGGGLPLGSAVPSSRPTITARRGSQTRAELEDMNETMRARLEVLERLEAEREGGALAGAIAETFGTAWDIARSFTPSPGSPLASSTREALGTAWGPVLAPYLSKIAGAMPIVAAVGVTYRVLGPHIVEVMADPKDARRTIAPARTEDAPAREIAEVPPESEASYAGEFVRPLGVVSSGEGDGYSPSE